MSSAKVTGRSVFPCHCPNYFFLPKKAPDARGNSSGDRWDITIYVFINMCVLYVCMTEQCLASYSACNWSFQRQMYAVPTSQPNPQECKTAVHTTTSYYSHFTEQMLYAGGSGIMKFYLTLHQHKYDESRYCIVIMCMLYSQQSNDNTLNKMWYVSSWVASQYQRCGVECISCWQLGLFHRIVCF